MASDRTKSKTLWHGAQRVLCVLVQQWLGPIVGLGLSISKIISPREKNPVMKDPATTDPKCLYKNTLKGWTHESLVPKYHETALPEIKKLNDYFKKLKPQIAWMSKKELRTIGDAPLNSQKILSFLSKSSLSPVQYDLNSMMIIKMKPVKNAMNNGM